MIRTILIDDEEKSMAALTALLTRYCPQVEIIAKAGSMQEAVTVVNELKPDLVFIDILMPDGTGFDVLERCNDSSFGVIFVTAFEEHALRAFRFAALHYLLKPVNYQELQDAVERFQAPDREAASLPRHEHRVEIAKKTYSTTVPESIVLHSLDGFSVAKIADIVRCEADSNYTKVIFTNAKPFLASRSLMHFEELLAELHFARVHHKHLINLAHVRKYVKGRGGMVEMADGQEVEVSTRKKDEFLEAMANFARGSN
jgi:two-component system LytT family response regulator